MNICWPYWSALICFTVHSTKSLDLHGDTHDLLKPIKTEPRPELTHDPHSTHEMKSSVIRIPHEFEWVAFPHTHRGYDRGFISFTVGCDVSSFALYGQRSYLFLLWFLLDRCSPKIRAGYGLTFFDNSLWVLVLIPPTTGWYYCVMVFKLMAWKVQYRFLWDGQSSLDQEDVLENSAAHAPWSMMMFPFIWFKMSHFSPEENISVVICHSLNE